MEVEIRDTGAIITADFSAVKDIYTIKSYLHSIFYNLLSNAIKYRLPAVPPTIGFQSHRVDGFVCVSVKDNGLGIDLARNGSKIFGLYKRFHGDAIPGKGIGLNLVKSHAESMGGRVAVESEINEGSLFSVYLPESHGKDASN